MGDQSGGNVSNLSGTYNNCIITFSKRMITSHLNHRPNQGQQKQGQKRKGLEEQEEDLRQLIKWKKAKKNASKECGEKGRDRGTGRSGVSDQSSGKIVNNYFYNNCGTITFNFYNGSNINIKY